MAVTKSKAYEVLGLEQGATPEEIRSAYKRLALQWHPDKHSNSEIATKKFQEISSAYKRLTTEDEEEEIELSFDEMFDLFTHLVFGGRGYIPAHYFYEESSDDDDYCCPHAHLMKKKNGIRNNHHHSSASTHQHSTSKPVKKTYSPFSYRSYTEAFEEARTNAEALIEEEEREKRLQEKKREKKRKWKQRKREEKENKAKLKTAVQRSASDDSGDSEDEEESQEKSGGDRFKVSSNNSNSVLQPASSSERNMPNKKSNSSADKKTTGAKKTGSENGTQNTLSSKNSKNTSKKKNKKEGSSGDDEATQGLDLNSAFCKNTVTSYNKKVSSTQKKTKKGKDDPDNVESAESKIQRSRKLAIRGNDLATKGDYLGAIELFSQAISLDPNDHRFFGNRSYCFDQSNQHDKALKDAERAISLSKDWPKGYFRKGRALAGLKSFNEAEKAYEQVLKLDPECEEAKQELVRVRVCQLMDMGFERVQSQVAVMKWGTVQAAAEALLSGKLDENVLEDLEEVYISDEEDILSQTIQNSKTDVRNPERLRSIWIGNVSQSASEKHIRDLFGRFGVIESMRRLPEKYCAFINYRDAAMASEAMKCLQGYNFFEGELLIKFPDHPISDGHPNNGTIYLKKTKPATNNNQMNYQANKQPPRATKTQGNSQQSIEQGAPRGPVNGNECYFWRTTGCWYTDRCRYLHLPASKGADLQPWHTNRGAGPP